MKRKFRLLKNQDFKNVLDQKQNVSRGNYTMYYSKNELSHVRVGISVSSKLGNSVVRHRVKRQFVSIVDNVLDFNLNYDIVIIARKKFFELTYQENFECLKKDINKFFARGEKNSEK
jgi:ribonuclease P protein component